MSSSYSTGPALLLPLHRSVKAAQELPPSCAANCQLELLLDESPAIAYMRSATPPYQLTFISDNVEALLGLRPADLLATPHAFRDLLVADERARLDEALAAAGDQRMSTTYRLNARGALRWLQDESRLARDDNGKPAHIVGHILDVTERHGIMDELFQSEERYSLAVQGSHAGLWDLDVKSNRIYISPRLIELLGYEEDQIGPYEDFRFFVELVHPDDRARLAVALKAHLEGTAPFELEFRARRKAGPYRWFHACGQASWVGEMEPARMAGWLSDVTERRRLEEELRQAQKMEAIGRLAGGVAHDFNNLLTVILGYARMVGQAVAEDSEVHDDANEIVLAAERAASLTRQLLAFSRQQLMEPRVVDLDDAIANLEKMLRRLIGADVALESRRGGERCAILIDPGQLEQVVLNLVVNARDAMPDGGHIQITTSSATEIPSDVAVGAATVEQGSFVVLSVSDSGMGMSAETQARIFEPFFTTKEKGKGTGLGLSTVYGIVIQSGGRIAIDSEVGRGTTFHVYFPRCDAEPRESQPRKEAPVQRETKSGGTVLLAEDEDQVRSLSRSILERAGFQVIAARSGSEALTLAASAQGPINLLVTDVVMPGMSGPQLHEALLRVRPTLGALFMSGYAETRSRPPEGAPFLHKPFSPEMLAARVRELVEAAALVMNSNAPEGAKKEFQT